MFNKSYNQVSADCAMLNNKLRGHKGGKLNSPARVFQLNTENSSKGEVLSWTNAMICAAMVTMYFLIKGLFTK